MKENVYSKEESKIVLDGDSLWCYHISGFMSVTHLRADNSTRTLFFFGERRRVIFFFLHVDTVFVWLSSTEEKYTPCGCRPPKKKNIHLQQRCHLFFVVKVFLFHSLQIKLWKTKHRKNCQTTWHFPLKKNSQNKDSSFLH